MLKELRSRTSAKEWWNGQKGGLDEGKKVPEKKKKSIKLAEKYGWEAADCYIQGRLACDPDRRSVQESKAIFKYFKVE